MKIKCFSLLLFTTQFFGMSLEEAKSRLSDTVTYQTFDMLSQTDKDILRKMQIKYREQTLGYNCNTKDFENYLAFMENDAQSIKEIAPILQKIYTRLSKIPNTTTMFELCEIVAEDELNNFNRRTAWHIDIAQESCKHRFNENLQHNETLQNVDLYKVLVNLGGQGTVLTQIKSEQESNFKDLYCKDHAGGDRAIVESIRDMLKNNHQDHLEFGQAVIFDMKRAIHKRPETIEKRARISFVYKNDRNNQSNNN